MVARIASLCLTAALACSAAAAGPDAPSKTATAAKVTLNVKLDGYRGIWYMNQPSKDEYVYKYSGGMATYCAKHQPIAIYLKEVDKTFFCYGGARADDSRHLLHMVSYFDHKTRTVPRPTLLLDKQTDDAHDNPVLSVDDKGHIWIFSTSHGRSRPSYIHRSVRPYDVDAFERIEATAVIDGQRRAMDNFSYMQAWHVPDKGFICFFTRYNWPAQRTSAFVTSPDGATWSAFRKLAAIGEGHYQISAVSPRKAATCFNYHPAGKGLNWRTNLYYMETPDLGASWRTADGKAIELPLTKPHNAALVHDYAREKLNVYLKDIRLDANDRPVLLYLTSKGYESGPANNPRTWTTARWTGAGWVIRPVTTSDNNYDTGSLYLEDDGLWRVIGPTLPGPQPFNPGGEMAMWTSPDEGTTWTLAKQLTSQSPRNHSYARRPVDAQPEFYALWADGHGRKPSESILYFCDKQGNVYELPRTMTGLTAQPRLVQEPR